MNISAPIEAEISSVAFGFYSEKDIENISVKQIVNPTVFDNLGHPTNGGLYDLALGPFFGKSGYITLESTRTCEVDLTAVQHVTWTNGIVLAISGIYVFPSLSIILCYSRS